MKSSFQHSIWTSAERICYNGSKRKAAGGCPACLAERHSGSECLWSGVILNFPNRLHEHVVCSASGCGSRGSFSQCLLTLWPAQNGLGGCNPNFRGQTVYIIKNIVSLISNLSGEPEEDWGQSMIIVGCCSSCARAASVVLNISYSKVQGRRFAKQSPELSSQAPGGLQVPYSFRKGLDLCSVFAPTSHGCQWWIYRSSLWGEKQESSPPWQNRCLHINKRVISKLQKHQGERTWTSQILKDSGTDFISDTCEILLVLIKSHNYNWFGISILLTGNRRTKFVLLKSTRLELSEVKESDTFLFINMIYKYYSSTEGWQSNWTLTALVPTQTTLKTQPLLQQHLW